MQDETAGDFGHHFWTDERVSVLTPWELGLDIVDPNNFHQIRKSWSISRIWLLDRIRGPKPLVQIVDHRNLSGTNPLRGKTPLGDRPRFPDVSRLYAKEDLGLPPQVVTTVGPQRFAHGQVSERSEVAALVALCAGYVGMEVIGLGWNDEKDTEGVLLEQFVKDHASTSSA